MSKVPSLRFDGEELPFAKRFAAFSSGAPFYDFAVADGSDPREFRAINKAWRLGEVVLTDCRVSPLVFERTAKDRSGWLRSLLPGPVQRGVMDR